MNDLRILMPQSKAGMYVAFVCEYVNVVLE